jgi:hypothetical protein
MSQTLNSIVIDVVGQYGEAAKHLVDAYRIGTERTISGLGGGYAKLLRGSRLPLVTDELKTAFIDTEQRMAGLAIAAIARAAERTNNVVDRVTGRAVEGLESFAEKTAWADGMMVVGAVRAINMPAAKLSLEIANRASSATAHLSDRIATIGNRKTPVSAKQGTRAAAKRARRASRKG